MTNYQFACTCLPPGVASPTNRDLLEDCLGSLLLALAVVMAGSGHLPTLKLLRGAQTDR